MLWSFGSYWFNHTNHRPFKKMTLYQERQLQENKWPDLGPEPEWEPVKSREQFLNTETEMIHLADVKSKCFNRACQLSYRTTNGVNSNQHFQLLKIDREIERFLARNKNEF